MTGRCHCERSISDHVSDESQVHQQYIYGSNVIAFNSPFVKKGWQSAAIGLPGF